MKNLKGDDISKRFIDFASRIISMTKAIEKDYIGKHINLQVLRSGTSCEANYEEARISKRDADFIHKLKIALKEMRETLFLLNVIHTSDIISFERLQPIICETEELCNIIAKSIITTQKRMKS